MNDVGTEYLKGKRVILRKLTMYDAREMFENWCRDEAVTEFVLWEPHESIDVTKAILKGWIEDYQKPWTYRWGMVDPLSGKLIGTIDCVMFSEKHAYAELGYCLARPYWGKGIVSEAVQMVVKFLLEAVEVNRIEARHATINPASGRVMQKAGMVKEGTLYQRLRAKDGGYWDLDYYAILRENFYKNKGDVYE